MAAFALCTIHSNGMYVKIMYQNKSIASNVVFQWNSEPANQSIIEISANFIESKQQPCEETIRMSMYFRCLKVV